MIRESGPQQHAALICCKCTVFGDSKEELYWK